MSSRKKLKISYIKQSTLIFMFIILVGSILLTLPVSSRNGEYTPFINALFTATSATCVTGLVVYDTYEHYSIFGQTLILFMIQIGGLGFMLVATMFSLLLRKRIGIRERGLIKESISSSQIGGVVRLAKNVLIGTFLIEGLGAIILSIRFSFDIGIAKGIYFGIFHSISAFCNAGFDLMGIQQEFSSLMGYQDDIAVNIVIMFLIVVGGIGFVVWEDIRRHKLQFRKYHLHSKMVLSITFFLIITSSILYYLLEQENLLAGAETKEKILSSFFMAVTPRTAGFNTIDIAGLSSGSKLFTMLLMLIGGSPGSTAGGIKTTTFAVVFLATISSFRHSDYINIFKRRLEDHVLKKAVSIMTNYILSAAFAILLIVFLQPELILSDVMFEVLSAVGTVGLSTGVTLHLLSLPKIIIILLMFFGRIGSLFVILSFTQTRTSEQLKNPMEKIVLG